jgi:light-regulated signal transduction histidine kinase (bacteriophytochrome)
MVRGEYFFIAFLRDITERKQTEEKIIRLNKELGQNISQLELVNKELEAFSYSVSHDLRAPLRAIHGYSKILKDDYAKMLDEDASRMLEAVLFNSQKMAQQIDELLSFSRLGRKEVQKTTVNMKELAESALREVKESMPSPKTKVKIHPLPPAEADYALMNHVFVNLISNAIKFSQMKPRPEVEIGCYTQENETIYFVKDNGAGFDMKYYDKLFGVFQRLHGRDEFEGTGVGLAIVKRIVVKHGGRVWAEGRPGEGAAFYFSLGNETRENALKTITHEKQL